MIRGPSAYELFNGWRTQSRFDFALGQITAVRRIKAQAIQAVDPITGQSLGDRATLATLTADIVTFPDDRIFNNVPVLTPNASIEGSGIFAVPQAGDLCLLGFLPKGDPRILGFYIPPDENDTAFGALPIALQSGEIAILAPGSKTGSGFFWLLGGVLRMQASPAALFEVTPAGDVISGFCRNFRLVQSGAVLEMVERDEADRQTFRRERIQRQAASENADAAFIEKQAGAIASDELFEAFRIGLQGENRFPGTIIEQRSVNDKTFTGYDDVGSRIEEFTDSDAVDERKIAGDRKREVGGDDTKEVTGDQTVTVDGEATHTFKEKLTVNAGDAQEIVIELDPSAKEATITIGGTKITVREDSVDIDATSEVNIDGVTVNLAGGAEGVALGQRLQTYLTTLVAELQGHTHPVTPGVTTAPSQSFSQPATGQFVSQKVKVS